ncbi:peptidase inhibitor family I36 protein [Nocardia sp. CA2R105]|uniref:peptidase inhibitor family I36 protein n=1 Tax=Nocardia coffeae TaxID=2873381 RepID=UPI001CA6B8FD|nr:peptidase inhibitor family I36 protein [Nocardia coffeae]MBY8863100.1 peptidase inhibitor family I36 protein [Nocardia coffeae]
MTFRTIAAAAMTTAALTGVISFAAPAQAATGYDRCPTGNFCVFTGAGGGGAIAYFKVGSSDLRLQGVDGHVHSVWNRTSLVWDGFTGYNYTGGMIMHVNGGWKSDFPAADSPNLHSLKHE